MKIICNHCKKEIDHLNYSCDSYDTEYGHCSLSQEDFEEDDREYGDCDNYVYTCPECSHDLDNEDIQVFNDDDVFLCSYDEFDKDHYEKTKECRIYVEPKKFKDFKLI